MLARPSDKLADFGAERAAKVEHILSARFGKKVQLIRARIKEGASSSRAAERSFWRLRVAIGDRTMDVHAKVSSRGWRRLMIDECLTGRGLPIPDFLGSFPDAKCEVNMWKHCYGVSSRDFSTLDAADIVRVVQAIAKISSVPKETLDCANLPVGVKWIEPVCRRIRKLLDAEQLASVRAEFSQLSEVEDSIIKELTGLECGTLTHNDIKGPNVLVGKRITLVDWESATIGPHGASLRRFTRHGTEVEKLAVQTYLDAMASKGFALDQRQLLRVMRFQELFWSLATGVRRGSRGRVAKGLKLVPEFFARPAAY